MSRPSKFTPEAQRIILEALRMGARREAAAKLAGVAPQTLSHWLSQKGEPWETFALEVDRAEGGAEVKAAGLVMKAAQKSPQWAAWWLEHKHPEAWGRHRVEVTGADGGPLAIDFNPRNLTDEQLARIAHGEDPATVLGLPGRGGAPPPTEGSGDLWPRPPASPELPGAAAP